MNAVYKDTETGGLYSSIHALLSIGAVCNWGPEIEEEVTFLEYITLESQPGKIVEAEAAAKNGYTREKWEELGARPLSEVIPEYLAWVEDRKRERPDAVFVCHHLAFDKPFIAEAARICGAGDLPHRNDWRCSQVLFGELMDRGLIERGSSSLNRLLELCGFHRPRSESHDALEDACITMHGHQWLLMMSEAAKSGSVSDLSGAKLIEQERFRQITDEGWTAEHDAMYPAGVLEAAAECYLWELRARTRRGERHKTPPPAWPWNPDFWKPCADPVLQLVKAGALSAAAIDLRLAKAKKEEGV